MLFRSLCGTLILYLKHPVTQEAILIWNDCYIYLKLLEWDMVSKIPKILHVTPDSGTQCQIRMLWYQGEFGLPFLDPEGHWDCPALFENVSILSLPSHSQFKNGQGQLVLWQVFKKEIDSQNKMFSFIGVGCSYLLQEINGQSS